MLLLDLLNDLDKDINGRGGEERGWVDLAAPDRVEENLAAACVLEIVLQQQLTALNIWIHIPTTFGERLLEEIER